ncbi:VOC family protein [Marivirga sp. S37H4]|uniref:VOC family protein n=2 Tax=Marivirga aurantiaca TaxID=2802615 RepID=A0A934WXU8_9BACT|nr:VOC family protein [Marivirga aurantiaca]
MFNFQSTFSGFSVDDLQKAKTFYRDMLGISILEEEDMGFALQLSGGNHPFIYPKPDHQPATFTVLNFVVKDIDAAIENLKTKGISFLKYNREDLPQDEKGVLRGLSEGRGPDIAWFEDPAGNVLSVLQEQI